MEFKSTRPCFMRLGPLESAVEIGFCSLVKSINSSLAMKIVIEPKYVGILELGKIRKTLKD